MVDTLNSVFRQQFQVLGNRPGEIHPSARLRQFSSLLSCKTFIRNIKVSTNYWRNFLQRQHSMQSPLRRPTETQVLNEIAELTLRKRISFYELPQITHSVMAHNGRGTGYNFIKGPGLLPITDQVPVVINSEEQAYEILRELKTEGEFWPKYLQEHELSAEKSDASQQLDMDSYIAGLLTSGALVVYSRAYAPPPPVPKILDLPEMMADKPVPLAPEKPKYESVVIDFQIDVDAQRNRNDVLTLTNKSADYESSIVLGDLWEFDNDWVRLSYADPPPSGNYTLVHDPKDGEMPYTIFADVPYASLKKLSPECEELVIHKDEDEEEDEAEDKASGETDSSATA